MNAVPFSPEKVWIIWCAAEVAASPCAARRCCRRRNQLTDYGLILENNDLKWDDVSMRNVDVDTIDRQCTLALIMGAIRAERFCDGAPLH